MDHLDEMLLSHVSELVQGRERVDAIDHALAAALAGDEERRAWALVSLGAELRRRGDHERALTVLDGAAVRGSDEARSAAFTCAAAIHRDLGDLTRARRAGETALALHDSDYARKVLAAIYYDLWRETKLEEFRVRWREVAERLEPDAVA